MKNGDILEQLRAAACRDDYPQRISVLAQGWSEQPDGFGAVEPILQFMEEHPSLDHGTPGPLVHFVETFFGKGNEELLLASLERKPVRHTVWMLNRLINGTHDIRKRQRLLDALSRAKEHAMADPRAQQAADHFLLRQRK